MPLRSWTFPCTMGPSLRPSGRMTPATATRTVVMVPKRESIETIAPSVWPNPESVRKIVGHREECNVRLIELHAMAVVVVGRNLTKSTTRKRPIENEMKVMKALIIVAASATDIRVTINVMFLEATGN